MTPPFFLTGLGRCSYQATGTCCLVDPHPVLAVVGVKVLATVLVESTAAAHVDGWLVSLLHGACGLIE